MTRTFAAKAKGRNARWQDEVLGRLPPKFRKELLLEMYKPQLMMCPLFLNLDVGIITRLATTLRPYLAVRNDKVFEEGQAAVLRSKSDDVIVEPFLREIESC